MFDALAKFFSSPRKRPAPPEAAFVIKLEGRAVTCQDPTGKTEAIAWADIASVTLSMSDGHLGWDYWILEGKDGKALSIPARAMGAANLRREFTSRLPGFDWEGGMITSGESACLWRSNGS